MAADRQQPSQDDILEAALAALSEDDIPPGEDCPAWRTQIAVLRPRWRT